MPGGSHNRKSSSSLQHVLDSVNKSKLCKCPIHRNFGNGTMIPQTKFKRYGEDGVQNMCAEGKTLIDSYSHMLKRFQLLTIVDKEEAYKILDEADIKFKEITDKIRAIITQVLSMPNDENLESNEFNLFLLTELDKKLKTDKTGFYDAPLTKAEKIEFNEYLKQSFTEERLDEMEITQDIWTEGCYIIDSKDHQLYPIEEFGFNVSKKRELYNPQKQITPYRVNVHNTRAKGGRSSTLRGEKYLADGEYTEANRRMKELGKEDRNTHADHIIPLALGGIHDARNLQPLPGRENIYKKDKLVDYALELLKRDISYLSRWHHDAFNSVREEPIELIQEILKSSVFNIRKKVIDLNEEDKVKYISKFYPTYKDSQIRRIIIKHFTKEDD